MTAIIWLDNGVMYVLAACIYVVNIAVHYNHNVFLFMGTSWIALSITNINTRASREMMSRKKIKMFDLNGGNVAKHWNVAVRGICHL